MTDWVNEDGLVVRFGPRPKEEGSPAVENTRGAVQTLIFEIGADIDTPQDLRQNGDTRQVPLKKGDVVVAARVQVEVPFDVATTVDVGYEDKAKATTVADAFVAAADLATLDAVSAADSGTEVGNPIPDTLDGPAYVTVAFDAAGSTVGRGRVLIDYLPRAGGLNAGEIGSGTGPSVA